MVAFLKFPEVYQQMASESFSGPIVFTKLSYKQRVLCVTCGLSFWGGSMWLWKELFPDMALNFGSNTTICAN
jgi:hypothetical protein